MKNQWQVWAIIGVVIIVIAGIFGFQAGRSSLFAQRQAHIPKIEYEFVSNETVTSSKPATILPAAATLQAGAPATAAITADPDKKYAIQIASFADQAKADLAQKKAGETGLSTYIAAIDLGEKGTWHRVYVGPFATKDEAVAVLPKVKASYQGGFVVAVK